MAVNISSGALGCVWSRRVYYALYLAGFLLGGTATAIGRTEENLVTPGSSSGTDAGGFLFLCFVFVLVFYGYLVARFVSLFSFNDLTIARYFLAGGAVTDLLLFCACCSMPA